MQKFYDVVLGQGSNFLSPVPNASVTIFTSPGNVVATIYSDNGVTLATNPLTTASDGSFSFYAANGRYTPVITYQGISKTLNDIVLEDDPANGQPAVITGGSIDNTPIGATTPSTGAFTSLTSASGALNGTVGATTPNSGAFTSLSSTSGALNGTVGATTPASGAFTSLSSTSGALNGTLGATTPSSVSATTIAASGAITPSQTNGLVGTTTNNNANAGAWGEFQTASGSGTALTSNTFANATSVSLTAGDWDVMGFASFVAAATTTIANITASVSTTSAAVGPAGSATVFNLPFQTGTNQQISTPVFRLSLSATTTVFLTVASVFGVSTMSVNSVLRARRVR